MGFGFVVARFGLFLQALQVGPPHLELRPYGPSFWFGTALIVLGVIVNILSELNHFRLVHELTRGSTAFNQPLVAGHRRCTPARGGLAMAIYLISVHESGQGSLEESRERSTTEKPENAIAVLSSRHSVDPLEETLPGWNSPQDRFAQRSA